MKISKILLYHIIISVAFIFTSAYAHGQARKKKKLPNNPSTIDTLSMNVGNTYVIKRINNPDLIGIYKRSSADTLYFVSREKDTFEIQKNIRQIIEVDKSEVHNGQHWFSQKHYARYIYGPSAFSLPKKTFEYHAVSIFLHELNYSITDNISVGAAISPLAAVGNLNGFFDGMLSIKLGNYKLGKKTTASMGLFTTLNLKPESIRNPNTIIGNFNYKNLPYIMLTHGTPDKNFSTGIGFSSSNLLKGELDQLMLSLSAIKRVRKNFALVYESHALINDSDTDAVFGAALRIFTKSICLDWGVFAFVSPKNTSPFLLTRYVDFSYIF